MWRRQMLRAGVIEPAISSSLREDPVLGRVQCATAFVPQTAGQTNGRSNHAAMPVNLSVRPVAKPRTRTRKIAKALTLSSVPYFERAPFFVGASCRRWHADGLHSAAA
jgi:hypothetical protein